MTPVPDAFFDPLEAGEHALPASFFGLSYERVRVHVLVGKGDAQLLSADEQQRITTFRSQKRRDEFVRGRTLVRRVLAQPLDVPPQALSLITAPEGGFLPVDGRHHVSLTHTGGMAAVALSAEAVGLDAERLRPVPETLAARLLAPGEFLPDVEAPLLHAWTAKEAVLKATGQGLKAGLRRLLLRWHPVHEGLIVAQAVSAQASFYVAVRLHSEMLWAVALPETGARADRYVPEF